MLRSEWTPRASGRPRGFPCAGLLRKACGERRRDDKSRSRQNHTRKNNAGGDAAYGVPSRITLRFSSRSYARDDAPHGAASAFSTSRYDVQSTPRSAMSIVSPLMHTEGGTQRTRPFCSTRAHPSMTSGLPSSTRTAFLAHHPLPRMRAVACASFIASILSHARSPARIFISIKIPPFKSTGENIPCNGILCKGSFAYFATAEILSLSARRL